jgi:predicted nucleic acid-binding protein
LILFDSNVLVAATVLQHPHHQDSSAVLLDADPAKSLLAAHSLAEAYSVLTRPSLPFRLSSPEAWTQLQIIAERFKIVTLNAVQSVDAMRQFSEIGVGPRLYDYLIAATGAAHGAKTIVTWNTRDFEGLFPAIRIVTPAALV